MSARARVPVAVYCFVIRLARRVMQPPACMICLWATNVTCTCVCVCGCGCVCVRAWWQACMSIFLGPCFLHTQLCDMGARACAWMRDSEHHTVQATYCTIYSIYMGYAFTNAQRSYKHNKHNSQHLCHGHTNCIYTHCIKMHFNKASLYAMALIVHTSDYAVNTLFYTALSTKSLSSCHSLPWIFSCKRAEELEILQLAKTVVEERWSWGSVLP